jgi:hypothetical protein
MRSLEVGIITVDEQLDTLPDKLEPTHHQDGEKAIRPAKAQVLESFQADGNRLRRWASEGRFEISWEHKESRTRNRYVDGFRIHMGPEGVAWRKSLRA